MKSIKTNTFTIINYEVVLESRSFTDKKIVKLEKETEKAILLKVYIEKNRRRGVRTDEFSYWLPKSQITIHENGLIAVPDWLLEKNKHLPRKRAVCSLNHEQLREQTGLDLDNLTSTDYLSLIKDGLAYWES